MREGAVVGNSTAVHIETATREASCIVYRERNEGEVEEKVEQQGRYVCQRLNHT